MNIFVAELHVHTVLSPCAEVEMIPPFIIQEAQERGINLLAITDHNAIANIQAVQKAAAGTGITVLPGIELQTREEVHSLCLFDTFEQVNSLHQLIAPLLPKIENDAEHFGEQFVVDETGEFIRRENQLLITSADISLNDAFDAVRALGGLFIPAHVNRKAFGLLANLGLVPTDIAIQALEISRHVKSDEAYVKFPQIKGYPLIQSGDVHRLDEFLGVNEFYCVEPTIAELTKAILGQDGRKLKLAPII
ncbi:MAG: PHP domain-containing protein [Anaerolineaceae bacterium]|nr:PHP domain-containing protein [Anaerolineaceae bacterium]